MLNYGKIKEIDKNIREKISNIPNEISVLEDVIKANSNDNNDDAKYLIRQLKLLTIKEYTNYVNIKKYKENPLEVSGKMIKMASKYLNEYISPTYYNDKICTYCGRIEFINEDDGVYICNHCGLEEIGLSKIPSYQDMERVNTSRYHYTKRTHFRDSITQWCGLSFNKVPKDVIDKIKLEDIKEKDEIFKYLKKNRLSKYYNFVNHIYHEITGTPRLDLSYLMNDLLELSDKFERQYEEMLVDKVFNRKNTINVNVKLWAFLNLLGYKCDIGEFHTLKSNEKLNDHINIVDIVLCKLNSRFK